MSPYENTTATVAPPGTAPSRRLTLRQRHAALRASNIFWNPTPESHKDARAPNLGQFEFSDWQIEQEFYNPVFYQRMGSRPNKVSPVGVDQADWESTHLLCNILVVVAIVQMSTYIVNGILLPSTFANVHLWSKGIVVALLVVMVPLFLFIGLRDDLQGHQSEPACDPDGDRHNDADDEHDGNDGD